MKWKGYPISEASWEPEEVFSDDGDLLTHYKERTNFRTKLQDRKILLSIIMNHNTPESAIINLSSVTVENMKTELTNRIYAMIKLA